MTDTTLSLPPNLSYSQKSALAECGGRYFLEKVVRVPSQPGWANVGGTAAHSTTEELDRRLYEGGEMIDDLPTITEIFTSFFAQETETKERISGFSRNQFRASGRASKEWPEKENAAWWLSKGPSMCASWVNWRNLSGMDVAWLPDSSLGIEVECRSTLGDLPEIVAYIDRVMANGDDLVILDLKFGSRMPTDSGQLDTYRALLSDSVGLDARWGVYWNGRTGSSTPAFDLSVVPLEKTLYDYRMASEQRLRGDFRYKPSNMCVACSVNSYCPTFGGQYADTIPQPWEISSPLPLRPSRDVSHDVTATTTNEGNTQ